jgi:hypothetical protein
VALSVKPALKRTSPAVSRHAALRRPDFPPPCGSDCPSGKLREPLSQSVRRFLAEAQRNPSTRDSLRVSWFCEGETRKHADCPCFLVFLLARRRRIPDAPRQLAIADGLACRRVVDGELAILVVVLSRRMALILEYMSILLRRPCIFRCPGLFPILMLILAGPTAADHLPEKLLATGQPEKILAAINLEKTKFDDVVRMYGPPTREVKVPNNPAWTGYVWETARAKLEVSVNRGPAGDAIGDVYIEGTDSGPMGSTGRGLRLGDDMRTLKRIYGSRFEVSHPSGASLRNRKEFAGVAADRQVDVQWKSQEFTLTIGFNVRGKIMALWLVPPECYPGECE